MWPSAVPANMTDVLDFVAFHTRSGCLQPRLKIIFLDLGSLNWSHRNSKYSLEKHP